MPSKVPIQRLSSDLVKIYLIPHVNFWKHKPVFLQTLYQSWVQSLITTLYLFSWNIYFGQNQPMKVQIFWDFWVSNSSCHFPNHKSVFLQILHYTLVSLNIAPLYFFSWNIIYFGQMQPIKVKIFETFEFSSQNSSNSWCQFWNDKSIPIQIFHHSSLSLLITPL